MIDNFITVRDCICYNAFVFMSDADTVGGIGHVWVDSCGLFAFSKIFSFAQNLEKIQIINNDLTFGVWTDDLTAAARYWRENGVVLEYKAGSGIWFQDNLVFGAKYGILINGPASGAVQPVVLMDVSGNSFDQVRYGIYVQGALGGLTQTTIVDNRFLCFNTTDLTLPGYAIYFNNTETTMDLTMTVSGNIFGQTAGHHIAIDTPATIRLDMTGNHMELCGFGQPTTANYANLALNAPNATVTISGCHLKGLSAQKAAAITFGVLSYSTNTLVMSAVEAINHQYAVTGAFGTMCAAACSSIGTLGLNVTGATPQVAAVVWN